METSEASPVTRPTRPKVGWLFEGGGAKGAYSFAFARLLHQRGVPMDAVSGTSVGALNAILFATNNVAQGYELWKTLALDAVLPFRLPRPLHWISPLLFFPHMVANFMAGQRAWVEPGPVRRVAETLILLIHWSPVFVIGAVVARDTGWVGRLGLSLAAIWLFSACIWLPRNESPEDMRKFQAMSNSVMIAFAKLGFIGFLARHLYLQWHIEPVPIIVPAIWISCLAVLVFLRMSLLLLPYAFTDHSPLRDRIREILRSPLRCPTYVTLAEPKTVIDPDFPRWEPVLAGPGVPVIYRAVATRTYVPRYFELTRTPEPDRTAAVLASTALPFGITQRVPIGATSYVDGGMADNLPIRPLVDLEACDIVIWMRLNPDECPEAEDRDVSHPDPKIHWQWTWRREDVLGAEGFLDPTEDPRHPDAPTVVPWRVISTAFPHVLRAVPKASLGGLLKFDPKVQQHRLAQGEEKAEEFFQEHRAILEPLIAAASHEQVHEEGECSAIQTTARSGDKSNYQGSANPRAGRD